MIPLANLEGIITDIVYYWINAVLFSVSVAKLLIRIIWYAFLVLVIADLVDKTDKEIKHNKVIIFFKKLASIIYGGIDKIVEKWEYQVISILIIFAILPTMPFTIILLLVFGIAIE